MRQKKDTRYRGPLLHLKDIKKSIFLEQIRANEHFQNFIRQWKFEMVKFEREHNFQK